MEQIESSLPPGFRFHPTEEEVVGYYLYRKINSLKFDLDIITDIDLYRIEPWDIQEKCKLGYDEQTEWYFFSHKDRKYPTGSRTNRATRAGFWKATGRDKAVLSKNKMIGMRKTLVFYKGRAPNGKKTDWIIHEYRLQTTEHAPSQEEGWVVCRAFKKPTPTHNQGIFGAWNHLHNNKYYYNMRNNNNNNNMIIGSPSIPETTTTHSNTTNFPPHQNMQPFIDNFERELPSSNNNALNNFAEDQLIMDLPALESPSLSTSLQSGTINNNEEYYDHKENRSNNNWEILDNLWGSSSFPNDNLPSLQLVPQEPHDELDNTFLGSFPNL